MSVTILAAMAQNVTPDGIEALASATHGVGAGGARSLLPVSYAQPASTIGVGLTNLGRFLGRPVEDLRLWQDQKRSNMRRADGTLEQAVQSSGPSWSPARLRFASDKFREAISATTPAALGNPYRRTEMKRPSIKVPD
jgi:hypothetical protein